MKKQILTKKQMIALNLMLEGYGEKEIAQQLHISQSAVSQMYYRIKAKLPALRYSRYVRDRMWMREHNY